MPSSVMPIGFTLLDWLVVAGYMLFVIAVGFAMSRGQSSTKDYFLGGRNLPWWVVGLSIVATETSALTMIGVPAMAIGKLATDPSSGAITTPGGTLFFMMIVLGHLIGRTAIAIWVVPYYFKGEVYTTYQLLTRAFGRPSRMTAAGISLAAITLGQGVRVYATAIPVVLAFQTYALTQDLGLFWAIMLTIILTMIYAVVGGIRSVVWTDMIQYFTFVFAGLYALWFILSRLAAPSGAGGWNAMTEVAGDSLRWFNSGFLTQAQLAEKLGEGHSSAAALGAQFANIFTGPFNIWMGLIGIPIGLIFAIGFDQMMVQRVLTCRNVQDGRKAVMLSTVLVVPQFLLFLLVGVALLAFYRTTNFDFGGLKLWDPALEVAGAPPPAPRADYVFPAFIMQHMPEGMRGFMLAAILSAASVSGAVSAMASIMTMDFYRPLSGGGTQKGDLLVSRLALVGSAVMLALVAVWASYNNKGLIFDLAFQFAGITGGSILGAFLFGMWKKRAHHIPAVAAMTVSALAMMALWTYQQRPGAAWSITWPWLMPIGTAISLAVLTGLNPFFPPPPDRSFDREEGGE